MTEETQTTEGQVQETQTEETTQPSNADWKNHPLTAKLTAELNRLKDAEADRKAKETQAQKEAELKAAEEKGNYEKALELQKQELEHLKAQHAAEILESRLTTELIKVGFNNDTFIRGAVTGYDADKHENVEAYIKSLVENDDNKVFLANAERNAPRPPQRTTATGPKDVNWDQVKQWETSKDRSERIKARELIKNYRETHDGEYPYKL